MRPLLSSMTRRRILSTNTSSCVATTTVVPGPVDAVEQLHDALARLRVEVPRGLVGQQDQGPVDEGAGDRDPLLLTAGELVGQVVPLVGQADQVEHLRHLVRHHVPGPADDLEREGHVLEDRLVGQEAEVLEDAADVAAQVRHPPFRQLHDVAAGLEDLAGVGKLLAEQEPDEGRLPGSGRADEKDEFALLDLDGDVARARQSIPYRSW